MRYCETEAAAGGRRGGGRRAGAASTVLIVSLLGLGGCATPQEIVSQREDSLAAAGVIVRPATTPARQAMLNRLPPHQFVQRVRGDTVTYVYADPLVCDCLYVGSQAAYGRYRQHVEQERLTNQQELTAQLYQDQAWNWGGGFGPGFGFYEGAGF